MLNHIKMLRKKAAQLESLVEKTSGRFNRGYLSGKAEAFKLAATSLSFSLEKDIQDVLNGDLK